jgi:hypothetical protein
MVAHKVAKVVSYTNYGVDEETRVKQPLDCFHAAKTHFTVESTAKHFGRVGKPVSRDFLPFVDVLSCLEHIEHALEVYSKAGNFLVAKGMR